MDKNLKKDVKVNKNKKIKKTKTKKPLKIDNFKKLDKSLDNKNIIKSKRTIKPLKKESKKTFNQKNSFIKITFLIFIIILIVSFLFIGFKIDGFFSKIFYKNNTVNVVSYNCLYTQNNSNSKLLVGCDHSSTKGYFCSESLNLKNQVYILEKSNCELLNTCSDGIKNQNETGTDCGGVCPPCFEPECTNNFECNDNNPCTNDVCSSGKCVNTNKPNDTSCGEGMVCQSGVCVEITPEPECTNNSQCNDNNPCTNDVCSSGKCVNTNKLNDTSCGEGMVCQNGVCVEITPEPECTNNSECNDNNPCTNDVCSSGKCVNTNIQNGTSCGDEMFCQNGICVGCQNDSDCKTDTVCKDYFCDLQTNKCSSTPINEGEFCGGPTKEYLTCNSGSCIFDPINLGLCDGPIIFYDSAAVYTLSVTSDDYILAAGQKLLGFASKHVNDDGELKCAGSVYWPDPYDVNRGIVGSAYGNSQEPPKTGYSYGEIYNDFIRTTDYVCRVKATYDTSGDYKQKNKWYNLGMSKVLNFIDYTTGSTTIDFTNTDNCTYVGN